MRIPIIHEESATGKLAELYRAVAGERGAVANVLRLHSLLPATLEDHFNLYKTLMFKLSRHTGIPRERLEMIGVFVSGLNRCEYCVAHHSAPWLRLGADADLVAAVQQVEWSQLEKLLEPEWVLALKLAEQLTREPAGVTDEQIGALKEFFSPTQVLHTVLVVNYFNFVNRNILAFGVPLEADFEKSTR